ALLAKKAAAVDEISGGRLILGLGAGWNEAEYRAFGFPFDHRVDRFEEAFTIIRTLLREGAVDFSGRYHQARDCPLLPPGARPAGPIRGGGDFPRPAGCRSHHGPIHRADRIGDRGVGRLTTAVEAPNEWCRLPPRPNAGPCARPGARLVASSPRARRPSRAPR